MRWSSTRWHGSGSMRSVVFGSHSARRRCTGREGVQHPSTQDFLPPGKGCTQARRARTVESPLSASVDCSTSAVLLNRRKFHDFCHTTTALRGSGEEASWRIIPAPPRPAGRGLRLLLASAAFLLATEAAGAGSIRDTVQATLDSNPEIGHRQVQPARRRPGAASGPRRLLPVPRCTCRGRARIHALQRRPAPGVAAATTTAIPIRCIRKEAQLTLSQMLFDGFETRSEVERQTARVEQRRLPGPGDRRVHRAGRGRGASGGPALPGDRQAERCEPRPARALPRPGARPRAWRPRRQRRRRADRRRASPRPEASHRQLARLARRRDRDLRADRRRAAGRPRPRRAAGGRRWPAGAEDAALQASVTSPTVLIAASDVDVAEAELRGTRANYLPRLDAELSASAADDVNGVQGENVGASALLVMRYNLFRGGADIAREREAFQRVNQSRAELQRARRKAEEEARLSYNALETARARAVALRERGRGAAAYPRRLCGPVRARLARSAGRARCRKPAVSPRGWR